MSRFYALLACVCALAFCACAAVPRLETSAPVTAPAPEVKEPPRYSRVYQISPSAGDAEIAAFSKTVEGCYLSAAAHRPGAKISYGLAPAGAAVPFSMSLVDCLSGGDGSSACADMLNCVEKKYFRARK